MCDFAKEMAGKKVNNVGNFAAVELNLLDGTTELHQFDGSVKVTMKMPFVLEKGSKLFVYRVNGEELQECKNTITDNMVTFETNYFSIFMFDERKEELTSTLQETSSSTKENSSSVIAETTTKSNTSPKTGDASEIYLITMITGICAMGILIIGTKKRNVKVK